jgi:endonuclease YncB( thermonuclease family)
MVAEFGYARVRSKRRSDAGAQWGPGIVKHFVAQFQKLSIRARHSSLKDCVTQNALTLPHSANCRYLLPMRIFTLAVVLLALLPAPLLAQDIVGRASVIDGDTIEVRGTRIRLSGIDAPESRQTCQKPEAWRCGQQSALALSDKLGQANVRCEGKGKGKYGVSVRPARP